MQNPADPTRSHADAQRERILEAAECCFIERGFRGATMADIAHRSGISPGLIYRYFENKQAVILASIERHLAHNRDHIGRMHGGLDLAESLGEAFAQWRERTSQHWHVALICEAVAESGRDPEVAAALREAFAGARDGLADWFGAQDAAAGAASPPRPSPRSRALLLQCLIEGLLIRAYCEPGLEPALVEETLKLATAMLVPDGGRAGPDVAPAGGDNG